MKMYKINIVLALLTCFSLFSCKSSPEVKDAPKDKLINSKVESNLTIIEPQDEAPMLKFATKAMENYFTSIKDNKHEAFKANVNLSKEYFDNWRKEQLKALGTLKEHRYIGSIDNPYIVRYMWKWSYETTLNNKLVIREALFNVFVVKRKGEITLFSAGTQ